ncbi:transglycosylase SLT domain-containing protein [Streptomyces sp. JNUCC 63]
MPANFRLRAHGRALTKRRKVVVAGAAVLGAATLAVSAAPSQAQTATGAAAVSAAPVQLGTQPIKGVKAGVTDQLAGDSVKIQAIEAKKQAAAKKATTQAVAKKATTQAVAKKAAVKKARAAHQVKQSASRSAERPQMQMVAASTSYGNNLDGWIRQSLAVMKQNNIPGSYHGLHKNIMRESSGNPNAINNWDINARNGIPSKGLLQVIEPTFRAHHVPGTSHNIYDPVANITAAANYAAKRYGSIDNVNSAY